MKFRSTLGRAPTVTFSEAARLGLAPDGGLYVPESFPKIRAEDFAPLIENISKFAQCMLAPFFEGDALSSDLESICATALNFPIPLKSLPRGNASVLELFHGPTCAFKDVGARFLAECAVRERARRRTVIVATSGDTGGAVASAFQGKAGIDVVILFPKGKVSARQEKQLTCWGDNVHALSVRGTFDDCQRIVKEALRDTQLSAQMGFASANSISVGRLLPQMTFHARASLQHLATAGKIPGIIIPTGNLGDAVAALWAKRMGFPIGPVILATNANSTLFDYFATGEYRARPSLATLANAMDVGDPSNVVRLRDLYADNLTTMRADVSVEWASDAEISHAIRNGEQKYGEIWCPHTAAAVVALERQHAGGSWIIAATAHPAKFETIVEPLIGRAVDIPPALHAILERPSRSDEIDATLTALRASLAST